MSEPAFTTTRLAAHLVGPGSEQRLQRVFEAAGDHFLSITGRPEPDPDAAERELRSSASTPGRRVAVLAAREADEPVGALGWWERHPQPDTALLGMLLIAREQRGQGLAREAVQGLERWLAERGIREIRTGVGAGDEAAHGLLHALGFEPLDQRAHVGLDRGRIMIALFRKPIGG